MQTKYITETNSDLITTEYSDTLDLEQAETLSIQAVIDVNTPAAATFAAGDAEVITVNFEDKISTNPGDYFVLVDASGASWAASIDVAGTDPEPTGAIWAAIAAGKKTHVDVSGVSDDEEIAALVLTALEALTGFTDQFTIVDGADGTLEITSDIHANLTNAAPHNEDDSGAGGIGISIVAGSASDVDLTANTITSEAHGFVTGLKGRLTTDGTLPAGLALATDYFVIVVDDDTYKLAASLADALLGTAIDITDQGTTAATHTFTPTALAGGSIKLQKSNDGSNWSDEGSATNITADATVWLEKDKPGFRFARVYSTLTAGKMSMVLYSAVKKV
jgi:hypothetical protein